MGPVALAAFEFLIGLTVCGLAGSAMELMAGRQRSLVEPFICAGHMFRSLRAAALAGPYMVLNDTLASWRGGVISATASFPSTVLAGIWLLATGVATLALATFIALHLV